MCVRIICICKMISFILCYYFEPPPSYHSPFHYFMLPPSSMSMCVPLTFPLPPPNLFPTFHNGAFLASRCTRTHRSHISGSPSFFDLSYRLLLKCASVYSCSTSLFLDGTFQSCSKALGIVPWFQHYLFQ